MPFDPNTLDETTKLLLDVRERLTPELWRPYSCGGYDGTGCLVNHLYLVGQHRDTGVWFMAMNRLLQASGKKSTLDLGKFNDTHTLEEVQAVVDKAIGLS